LADLKHLNFVLRIFLEFIIFVNLENLENLENPPLEDAAGGRRRRTPLRMNFEFVPIRYTHTASRPDLSGEMSVANRDLVIVSCKSNIPPCI
jgi:hypothetical protein